MIDTIGIVILCRQHRRETVGRGPAAGVEVEGRWPSKCSSHDIRPKHAHNPLSAPLYDIDVLDYVAIEPWCWYGAGGGCHGYDHDLVVCCSSNS